MVAIFIVDRHKIEQIRCKRPHKVLLMLDLSAAYDVVNHTILLERLNYSFGISDSALSWIESYLKDRSQREYRDVHAEERFLWNVGLGMQTADCRVSCRLLESMWCLGFNLIGPWLVMQNLHKFRNYKSIRQHLCFCVNRKCKITYFYVTNNPLRLNVTLFFFVGLLVLTISLLILMKPSTII
jgi:hypothetical protein